MLLTYEERLDRDLRWAFLDASSHFERASSVHRAMEQVTRKLGELAIPYAVAGAMALFFHGYRRFTTDVDILVTSEGLRLAHERLEGNGYWRPSPTSKCLRDVVTGVRIDFLTAEDYRKGGEVNPADVRCEIDGIQFLQL